MTDTPNRPPLSPAAQAVLDHFLADVEISLEHGITRRTCSSWTFWGDWWWGR